MGLSETVECLCREMLRLDSGALANLRRMDIDGPGTITYWSLAARCDFLNSHSDSWMRIVKIFAILTPRGERGDRRPLHDGKRKLGAILCDGGSASWPGNGEAQPVVSEDRLARLLAQPPQQIAPALERIARMLAARRDPEIGIDCVDIAALILAADKKHPLRNLARYYYQCLDRANASAEKEETAA